MEENSIKIRKIRKKIVKRIGKIQQKSKLNSEMTWKLWEESKSNSEKIGKIQQKSKLNSEMICK